MKKKEERKKNISLILMLLAVLFGIISFSQSIYIQRLRNAERLIYMFKNSLYEIDNMRIKHLISIEKSPVKDEKKLLDNITMIINKMKKIFPEDSISRCTDAYNEYEKKYLELNSAFYNNREKFKRSLKEYRSYYNAMIYSVADDLFKSISIRSLFSRRMALLSYAFIEIFLVSLSLMLYFRANVKDSKTQSIDSASFIAGLAHEIKNPLSAIVSNLQLLAMDIKNEELSRAIKETKRLHIMLDDYLKLLRPVEYVLEPVKLSSIVTDIQKLLKQKIKQKNISISTNIPHKVFNMDRNQIKQLIFNLVLNAIDAVGEDGTISISANIIKKNIVIAVKDDGPGVDEELIEKIFSPFFSKKDHGSGMGLFICRNIVEKAGGKLIYSRKSDMTCFEIVLPIVEA